MGCLVCGDAETRPTKVKYIDETTEHISLCQDCLMEFKKGDLIADVLQDDAQSA